MNMFKKNGGFTLVELIVVIAILAILAGIAVPAYSGYIKKAEQAADVQMLSPIATAAQGLAIEKQVTVSKLVVTTSGGAVSKIEITHDGGADVSFTQDEILLLTGTLKFNNDIKATWENTAGKWKVEPATT